MHIPSALAGLDSLAHHLLGCPLVVLLHLLHPPPPSLRALPHSCFPDLYRFGVWEGKEGNVMAKDELT